MVCKCEEEMLKRYTEEVREVVIEGARRKKCRRKKY